jgi:hypothetical protein
MVYFSSLSCLAEIAPGFNVRSIWMYSYLSNILGNKTQGKSKEIVSLTLPGQ